MSIVIHTEQSAVATGAVTPTVATFDAKLLAEALKNKKNRAIQVIETGRARYRDNYTPGEVAAFVNGYLDQDEQLTPATFSDSAVKNLVTTYRWLGNWDIIEGSEKLTADLVNVVAKALNVVEKGQSLAVKEAEAAIDALNPEDPRFLKDVFDILGTANKRALELRKNPPAPEITEAPESESEEEGDEPEQPTAPAGRSLVDVIIANLAALDLAGVTDEEATRLMDAFDKVSGALSSRA